VPKKRLGGAGKRSHQIVIQSKMYMHIPLTKKKVNNPNVVIGWEMS